MFGINNNRTLISEILTVLGPLKDKLRFPIPWDLKLKVTLTTNQDHKTSKIKLHSIIASERYL